jgi:rod shape-determining protein MreC
MREELAPRSIAASVVTTRLSGQSRVLVIAQGSEAGVRTDMPVVSWGGLVGRVITVGAGYSKVRLLSDPNSGVAGIVQRSRAGGMVLGRGDGPLELAYVPKYADVEVGDRVVTSGLEGIFPKGLGVGRVTAVSDPAGASKAIQVEPEVRFGALEEVLVLLDIPGGGNLLTAEGDPMRPGIAPGSSR